MVTFDTELAAMHFIAETLAPLDEATRLRVLTWATERFRTGAPGPLAGFAVPVAVPVPARPRLLVTVNEPIAAAENLDDIFDPPEPGQLPAPAADGDRQSVTGMLSEFVAEFQDVVREWNGACETDGRDQRASNAA